MLVCLSVFPCLIPARVLWIYPQPALWTLLPLFWIIALVPGLPLLSSPLDIVRRSPTHACSKDYSCVLPMPYLFAVFWPCLNMTMFCNKKLANGSACFTSCSPRHRILGPLGSSSFSDGHSEGMDITRNLFALKQGPRSLEQHIREFLAIANYSDLPDITLIEIFCDGIHQPLRSEFRREGTRASLAQFLDYALLTVGSSFTVGVAEERDTAPNCVNTATLEHAHQMAATTTPRSVIAANHKPSQVTAKVKKVKSSPSLMLKSQVKSPLMLRSQVKSTLMLKSQVKSPLMLKSQIKSQLMLKSQVKSQPMLKD